MSQQSVRRTLQDRHLDMMIQLAFMKDEEEEIQKLLDTPDPTLSPEEEEEAKRIFQVAIDKSEKKERRNKMVQFSSVAKKVVPRFIQLAASIILIAGIATPIALANSAYFRSRVMMLLAKIDNEKGEAHFSFEEDSNASFYVPPIWTGEYYPSYIPDNFELVAYDEENPYVELRSPNGAQIFFIEMDKDVYAMSGTEGASVLQIVINGRPAYIIDDSSDNEHSTDVIWALDTKWFRVITYNLDTSVTIRIADSVKKIIK